MIKVSCMSKSESQQNDQPSIRDMNGRWDERVALVVVSTPFALVLTAGAVVAGLAATGVVATDITISGTIPIYPLTVAFGGLLSLTWLLALMKVFGVAPVMFLANRLASVADNYKRE